MKNLFGLVLIIMGFHSSGVFGRECISGEIGTESYQKIVFNESSVEFQVHETFFKISEDDYTAENYGNYLLILDKVTTLNSEGERYKARVDSVILSDASEIIVYLAIDGAVISKNKVFNCD